MTPGPGPGTPPDGTEDEVLRFEVLGPVRVWRAEGELDPGFPQQRALLALLLAHAGRAVPTSGIVDVLWPERPPASALNVVRRYAGTLRRLLEPGLPPRAPGRRLPRRTGGYLLEAATDEVDLLRFRELTRQGKRAAVTGRPETAARQFLRALEEWRGPVAMGIPASVRAHVQFTAVQRELLETARLAADAALLCGQAEQALPALRRATAQEPLDEPLHARLVLLLAACGLQAEALRAYEDVRRRLARELGLMPGAELSGAHTRVLRQDVGHRLRRGPVVHLGRPIATTKPTTTPDLPAPAQPLFPQPATAAPTTPGPAPLDFGAPAVAAPDVGTPGPATPRPATPAPAALDLGISHRATPDPVTTGSTALGLIALGPVRPGPAVRDSVDDGPAGAGLAGRVETGGAGRAHDAPAGPGGVEHVRPAQLPSAPPAFVGRAAESEWLETAARSAAGVVVVSGMAGVGKTTLALHWAHRAVGRFPDGQLYVALGGSDPVRPAVEPADALRVMLTALGVPASRMPAGVEALTGMYRTLLARRRVLVLLDDAAGTGQLGPLLPTGPGCLALVTSRHALPGLVASGARPLRLAPPSAEDAYALLAGRVGAERTAAEHRAAEEIVARCGRLPLALATVAARVTSRRDLPLGAVAAGLREADGGLDALAAAREAFLVSYRLLAPDCARLFRLLPRHEGSGITPAGAAVLAGLPVRRARLLLGVLADAHLLGEPAPGRYALHDLLRAFARERAAAEGPPRDR
ncbi:AfsR/SARP family transcriptional regulator [Streptomyces rishiriensis]|uniref:DNA-binding SARP family transcriptional activator n=1 Tax=Streptomyces rishiriensis TaxID=68264 RepID=A0ABU0NK51_STRRH|nr:BTAD domain-containing putative transcriptional regulator [Streptomyces rishiriensis]MDQ0579459.1 DNA-binding SARP family transcriptional activator [Streptomyces rishiriensis]